MIGAKKLLAAAAEAAGGGTVAYETATSGTTAAWSVTAAGTDLVLLIASRRNDNAISNNTGTLLVDMNPGPSTHARTVVYWGIGMTSGTLSGAESWTAIVFSGTSTSAPSYATANGSSTTPNPPSLSGFTTGDFAVAGIGVDLGSTITAESSGYSLGSTDTGTGCPTSFVYNSSPSATEDPGTFTLSGTEDWNAITIKVSPA